MRVHRWPRDQDEPVHIYSDRDGAWVNALGTDSFLSHSVLPGTAVQRQFWHQPDYNVAVVFARDGDAVVRLSSGEDEAQLILAISRDSAGGFRHIAAHPGPGGRLIVGWEEGVLCLNEHGDLVGKIALPSSRSTCGASPMTRCGWSTPP